MLNIKNLYYQIGNFKLNNVCLNINHGDYFVLLGESGSGKTLLLEIIAGFRTYKQGEIFLKNENLLHKPVHKRGIAYIPNDGALFPHLNVKENLWYAINKHTYPLLNNIIESFGLTLLLNKKPAMLSSGEKQKVAIARALLSGASLFLFDEPLSSIDVHARYEIMLMLRQLNQQGYTVLHVTHDYYEALTLATHVAVLHQGKIIQTGKVNEIFNQPNNLFVAKLSGIKNVFNATLSSIEKKQYKINSNLTIVVNSLDLPQKAILIIPANDIVLSIQKIESSMKNSFLGIVKDIIKSHESIDVLIDMGVLLHVCITEISLSTMDLIPGKEVWISFKASSVKVLPSI
ncbi:MAG: ABC transporter ATP-binding protein [Bacteroidales bacterium]|nr:ABC transporter ATP-binding protein [Bacteroidales bacterium]